MHSQFIIFFERWLCKNVLEKLQEKGTPDKTRSYDIFKQLPIWLKKFYKLPFIETSFYSKQ